MELVHLVGFITKKFFKLFRTSW